MAESIAPHRGSPPPHDATAAVRIAFPKTTEDFEIDPRVSYSKLDDKWILEDDDGAEWEWDTTGNRWIQSLDHELVEKQKEAYAYKEPAQDEPSDPNKKRKQESQEMGGSKKAKTSGSGNKTGKSGERKNTAVYASSIPLNADIDEVHSVFSRYGMIAEEIDERKPRIKLYTDESGNFKGDALIVYFRPESVQLAIQMLDETDFRLGQEGPNGKMSVKEADMSYKRVRENPAAKEPKKEAEGFVMKSKMKRDPRMKDRNRVKKKTELLNARLADWSDDEPSALRGTSSRWDKVVVLRHMFTLEELEKDPDAISEIKQDVRDECSKLGHVSNTILFDAEPDGIVTVRFGNNAGARSCVNVMHGRHFGGRVVHASIATGNEQFKKTHKSDNPSPATRTDGFGRKVEFDDSDEDDKDDDKRLDEFGNWLENEA